MTALAAKKADPMQSSETVTSFLRREVANTAGLYFAPVSSAVRTIHDIWVASGSIGQLDPNFISSVPYPKDTGGSKSQSDIESN